MRMRVIIVTWTGEFTIEAGVKDTVLQIKQKIEQITGDPVASQNLTVCGWELIDGLDMEDYPIIVEGTKIDLAVTPLPLGKIQITVKFSTRRIDMEVDSTDTVGSLKEKIHIVDGTPIKRMILFFSGTELEDDYRNLIEYGICDQSEIIVYLKAGTRVRVEAYHRRLNFVVQTSSTLLNSTSIPMEMKDACTISELRRLLLDAGILPSDDYFFIHKQRIMRDDCSLRWHGVENGDSLYVFKGTVTRAC